MSVTARPPCQLSARAAIAAAVPAVVTRDNCTCVRVRRVSAKLTAAVPMPRGKRASALLATMLLAMAVGARARAVRPTPRRQHPLESQ